MADKHQHNLQLNEEHEEWNSNDEYLPMSSNDSSPNKNEIARVTYSIVTVNDPRNSERSRDTNEIQEENTSSIENKFCFASSCFEDSLNGIQICNTGKSPTEIEDNITSNTMDHNGPDKESKKISQEIYDQVASLQKPAAINDVNENDTSNFESQKHEMLQECENTISETQSTEECKNFIQGTKKCTEEDDFYKLLKSAALSKATEFVQAIVSNYLTKIQVEQKNDATISTICNTNFTDIRPLTPITDDITHLNDSLKMENSTFLFESLNDHTNLFFTGDESMCKAVNSCEISMNQNEEIIKNIPNVDTLMKNLVNESFVINDSIFDVTNSDPVCTSLHSSENITNQDEEIMKNISNTNAAMINLINEFSDTNDKIFQSEEKQMYTSVDKSETCNNEDEKTINNIPDVNTSITNLINESLDINASLLEADKSMCQSVNSAKTNPILKKKANKSVPNCPVFNLEDIFFSKGSSRAHGINFPQTDILMTPKSAEACLRHGINPEILKLRNLDCFWLPNIDPEVQRLRYEAYTYRRHEIMTLCRTERNKLIEKERILCVETASKQSNRSNDQPYMTSDDILDSEKAQNETLILIEERRTEKMKQRQMKEIAQLLEWEFKMKKLEQEAAMRAESEALEKEKREEEKKRHQKSILEERRLREIQKSLKQQEEENWRKEILEAQHEKDLELMRKRQIREKEARLLARREDEASKLKAQLQRQQTLDLFEEQRQKALARLNEMDRLEAIRMAKVEEKLATERIEKQKKRDRIEQRILKNIQTTMESEKNKKEEFFTRNKEQDDRRLRVLTAQKNERKIHAEQRRIRNERQEMALLQTREAEQQQKLNGLLNLGAKEDFLQHLQSERERERQIRKERNDLHNQIKQENVRRMARVEEFRKSEMQKKVENDDRRTSHMARRHRNIIMQRRQVGILAKVQRDAIINIMSTAKNNRNRAAMLLKDAMGTNGFLNGINVESTQIFKSNLLQKAKCTHRTFSAQNSAHDEQTWTQPTDFKFEISKNKIFGELSESKSTPDDFAVLNFKYKFEDLSK